MTRKELYDKLTPEHLGLEQGYDEAAFAALKEALSKQARNNFVLTLTAIPMLIASVVLAATVNGVPIIPCWLAYIILALSLKTRKWNMQVKTAGRTLGIERKGLKTAVCRLKKEAGYISPWATFGFYAGLTIACLLLLSFVIAPIKETDTLLTILGIVEAILGVTGIILCLLFRQKAVWIVAAAAGVGAFIGSKGAILPLILLILPYLILLPPIYLYIGKAVKLGHRPPDLRKFWLYAAPVLALAVYALLIVASVMNMVIDSEFSLLVVSMPFCCAAGIAGVYLFCKKKKQLPGIVLVLLPLAFFVLQSVVMAANRIEWELVYIFLAPFILLLSLVPLTRNRKSDNPPPAAEA